MVKKTSKTSVLIFIFIFLVGIKVDLSFCASYTIDQYSCTYTALKSKLLHDPKFTVTVYPYNDSKFKWTCEHKGTGFIEI